MQHDFWHQRWHQDRLGFHQQKVNSRLTQLWETLAVEKSHTVFVPLCGKSLDMLWLAEHGYKVFGVEISDLACRDFYQQNKLRYQIKSSGYKEDDKNDAPCGQQQNETDARFIKFSGRDIELWCGDFFDLQSTDISHCQAVYDRAALIALPQAMRHDYAKHLAWLLPSGAQILLISMDYDTQKMQGPPFSVPQKEVCELFESQFSVQIISQSCGPDVVGNLAERGLDTLNEKIYRLTRC